MLVVVPLALGHPAKARDTDALVNSLRPFSVDKIRARAEAVTGGRQLFGGFRDGVIPQVAARARTSPQSVEAKLGEASPQLSSASLDETEAMLDRFEALTAVTRRIQPLLVEADATSAKASVWLVIGPGIVLVLAGAYGVAALRARPPVDRRP
jgi:hypothetical protein